jgi:hypothetical protein
MTAWFHQNRRWAWLWVVPGVCLVLLLAGASPEVEAPAGPEVAVGLTYRVEGDREPGGRGGIVGRVEDVRRRMEEAGGTSTRATCTIIVTPHYSRGTGGAPEAVTLTVGDVSPRIDEGLPTETRRRLTTEIRRVVLRLRRWSKELDEEQRRTLSTPAGRVELPLREPFDHLELFSAPPGVVLELKGLAGGAEVRFLAIGPWGTHPVQTLTLHQPMLVEVRFPSAPELDRYPLEIVAGGGALELTALRTEDDARVFRTRPFLPVSASASAGLPSPEESRP